MALAYSPTHAQGRKMEVNEFLSRQDSLKRFADAIVQAREPEQRFRADSFFVRMLVRTLKLNNSFYFPFDSLQTISNFSSRAYPSSRYTFRYALGLNLGM